MALSSVLPPGYRAFKAVQQQNEQSELADLQKAQMIRGMLAQMQAQQREQAFTGELDALGPGATQEQQASVAARHVRDPKALLDIQQRSLDRKATVESTRATSEARLEQQAQFANLQHEARMARAATDEARATEVARHNKVMEGLQAEIVRIRGDVAASRPEPQPRPLQVIQGPEGPMYLGPDGKARPITDESGNPIGPKAATERALPSAAAQKLFDNQTNLRRAETALALMEGKNVGEMKGDADATGWKGFVPDAVLQRLDPKGIDARAALADLGSLVIHERSGAAVTAAEFPRLQPFIPTPKDDPETVKKKLRRFAQIYRDVASETSNFYRESGYKVPELKSLGGDAPAAASGPKFEEGKVYVDAKGNRARYQGGKFVPVK